ncbi:MAG: Hsp20 family protein [Pseudomonadales bacterium]
MARLDLTPLFRSTVGFDRLASMLDAANRVEQPSYPPYNIELVDEDRYRISMAVAGFNETELNIESEHNTLTVTGVKQEDSKDRHFLHQGIAARNFERKFQLADYVKVTGANMENGLLHIDLMREIPEAMKPRKIAIGSGDKLIEANRAEDAA